MKACLLAGRRREGNWPCKNSTGQTGLYGGETRAERRWGTDGALALAYREEPGLLRSELSLHVRPSSLPGVSVVAADVRQQ